MNGSKVDLILKELMERYPVLMPVKEDIFKTYEILRDAFLQDGTLLIAGNGGSCADSEHIVGELMKGFVKRRPVTSAFEQKLKEAEPELGEELAKRLQVALPAIALTGHPALSTAFLNDVDGSMGFAQQVYGYGRKGDVFLGITTSGNSKNILYAAAVAKAAGLKVIGLTGRDGGRLKAMTDACIVVPEQETFKIQEFHLPVYHALCLMLEEYFYEV